jgi:outer membrane immunogenic protein
MSVIGTEGHFNFGRECPLSEAAFHRQIINLALCDHIATTVEAFMCTLLLFSAIPRLCYFRRKSYGELPVAGRLSAGLIGGIAAVAFAQIASAADLPSKAPAYALPPPPPPFSWTGFYVGAQAGWSRIHDSQDMSSPSFALSESNSADGAVGGVNAGYNFQMNQFVFGVEGDFEGNSTHHSFFVGPPFSPTTTATEQLRWQGSLRARLGVAFDRVLFYGTGGWAFGNFRDTYFTPPGFGPETVTGTRDGWTAGGGVEYALNNYVTARVEFRYTDWGSHTNTLVTWLVPPGQSIDHVTQNVVRVGVDFKFGP